MLDFDTVCEKLTNCEDSVLKIEAEIEKMLDKNIENVYIFSFVPIRTFNFLDLDEDKKENLVKEVITQLKNTFDNQIKIFGRHALVWGYDKKSLENKLFEVVKQLKEKDIPIYVGVLKVSKDLTPEQIILDLERCLFMPMCVPDQMLLECMVRFCEDIF